MAEGNGEDRSAAADAARRSPRDSASLYSVDRKSDLVQFVLEFQSIMPRTAYLLTNRPITIIGHTESKRRDFRNIWSTVGQILFF